MSLGIHLPDCSECTLEHYFMLCSPARVPSFQSSAILSYLQKGTLAIHKTASLGLPKSVTWLRIVGGRWLLVAASNQEISTFSCWTLTDVFEGKPKPLAERYLPGPVHDGEVEVQMEGVVIAISIGSRCDRAV